MKICMLICILLWTCKEYNNTGKLAVSPIPFPCLSCSTDQLAWKIETGMQKMIQKERLKFTLQYLV